MKKIAVLTSGGDAAGMNAAIRAVTRTAIEDGLEVVGVRNGYAGSDRERLCAAGACGTWAGIMQHGGTMLGSARSAEFRSAEGRAQALANLRSAAVDGLVVIGGERVADRGRRRCRRWGFRWSASPRPSTTTCTASEITIGVDTALNVALEAIDRLKVTASSHRRAFLVEVMGRDCGYLALMAGIAGGAEAVVDPGGRDRSPEKLAAGVAANAYERGKPHALIVVAEGAQPRRRALVATSRAPTAARLRARAHDARPRAARRRTGAFDRLLATRLGSAAAVAAWRRRARRALGLNRGEITDHPAGRGGGRAQAARPGAPAAGADAGEVIRAGRETTSASSAADARRRALRLDAPRTRRRSSRI